MVVNHPGVVQTKVEVALERLLTDCLFCFCEASCVGSDGVHCYRQKRND